MDATKTEAQVSDKLKCDVSKIKPGSYWSRHSFGAVLGEIDGPKGPMFQLRNKHGLEWSIEKTLVAKEFSFSDQFDETRDVSRTTAIDALTAHPFTAMTVCYHKKVEVADKDGKPGVATKLKAGQGGMSDKEWKKLVAEAIEGELRTMIGFHTNSWDEHRRLRFEEHNEEHTKLVDPRTLNWLIVNRVKYVVSK